MIFNVKLIETIARLLAKLISIFMRIFVNILDIIDNPDAPSDYVFAIKYLRKRCIQYSSYKYLMSKFTHYINKYGSIYKIYSIIKYWFNFMANYIMSVYAFFNYKQFLQYFIDNCNIPSVSRIYNKCISYFSKVSLNSIYMDIKLRWKKDRAFRFYVYGIFTVAELLIFPAIYHLYTNYKNVD